MSSDDIYDLLSSLTTECGIDTEFYKCPFCLDTIYGSLKYKDHVMNKCEHSKYKQPRYVCFLCPRTFLNMSEYKKHQHDHLTTANERQCNKCYKILCSKYYAEIHQERCDGLINSIVPEYHCQKCDKHFSSKKELNRHLFSCVKNEMLSS